MLKRLLITVVIFACLTTFLTIQQTSKYQLSYKEELRDGKVFIMQAARSGDYELAKRTPHKTRNVASTNVPGKPEDNHSHLLLEEYYQLLFKSEPYVRKYPMKASSRLLLPILFYNMGPNNVIRLFKESIPIAQALNRTLIVPPFHHHPRMHLRNEKNFKKDSSAIDIEIFDQTYKSVVENNPERIIDIKSLRYYVPTTSMESFSALCDKQLSTMVTCGVMPHKRVIGLRQFVNFNDVTCRKNFSVNNLRDVTEGRSLKINLLSVQSSTHNDRCIGLAIGSRCLGSRPAWFEQWRQALPFVRRPPEIKVLAQKFVSEILRSKRFLAVHWRYDTEDWQDMCKPSRPNAIRNVNLPLCEIAQRMESNISLFNTLITKLLERARSQSIDIIYFSAPPQFLEVVMQSKPAWSSVYVMSDVERFSKRNKLFEFVFENNFRVSLLEQELCYLSEQFLGSPLSAWTQTVLVDRVVEGRHKHESVLDVWADDENKGQFPKLNWYFPEGD